MVDPDLDLKLFCPCFVNELTFVPRQQYMVGPERLYLASRLNLTEAQVCRYQVELGYALLSRKTCPMVSYYSILGPMVAKHLRIIVFNGCLTPKPKQNYSNSMVLVPIIEMSS